MERYGSGLRKIVRETEKPPGYTAAYNPKIFSTATDFRVILKNVNYHHGPSIIETTHDKTYDATYDTPHDATHDKILAFCIEPHSKLEIAEHCGYKNTKNFTQKYLRPLLNNGTLKMTLPDKPKSKHQKYITVRTE